MERGRDAGLLARMVLSLGLVVAADAAFVVASVVVLQVAARQVGDVLDSAVLHGVADAILDLAVGRPLLSAGAVLVGTVLLLPVEYAYARYRHVHSAGSGGASPELRDRVQRLAKVAGIPAPDVRVVDDEVPNSFAVGRRGSGTLVVTTGLVATLDGRELDAVLAHELAHLLNRDATVMTVATAPVEFAYRISDGAEKTVTAIETVGFTVGMLALGVGAGLHLLGFDALGVAVARVFPLLLLVLVLAIPLILVGAVFAYALAPAPSLLSRYREYAADRGAAYVTGDPAALASALRTLSGTEVPTTDRRRRDPGVAALCLLPHGLSGEGGRLPASLVALATDHPPVEARTDRLSELVVEFETRDR